MGKLFVLFDSIVREGGSLNGSAILAVTYGEDSIYEKNKELRTDCVCRKSGAIWVEFEYFAEYGKFEVIRTRPDLSEDYERDTDI